MAVIPFRAKATTSDWKHANQLLEDTLRSILHGSNLSYVVLVTSDNPDLPDDLLSNSRLDILRKVYKIPSSKQEQMEDKYLKLRDGLEHIRPLLPAWVMRMDADDLIGKRFFKELLFLRNYAHYAIDGGYVWEDGASHLTKVRSFHRLCGSSLASFLDDLPQDLSDHWLMRWGHNIAIDNLLARGDRIAFATFPAAIYRVATGENWTGMGWSSMSSSRKVRIKRWLARRWFARKMRREFGLE